MIDLTAIKPTEEFRVDLKKASRLIPSPITFRSGSYEPMKVSEVVTVCMGKLIHEMREFLPSVRVAFPECPIYVYTDNILAVQEIAEANLVNNVIPVKVSFDTPSFSKVIKHSVYWHADAIYFKLKALLDRVKSLPSNSRSGVMIVDCDVTFNDGFEKPFFGDVALSPFYWGKRDLKVQTGESLQSCHGEFNAGMLVSRSIDFCNWWIDAYIAGLGGFYEQACLDFVPKSFCVDYISPLHNFGKWRFAKPHKFVRSYHQHILERSKNADVGALKIAAQSAAAKARKSLLKDSDL